MSKIQECWVKCDQCGERQPSFIHFGDVQSFETGATWGNTQECISCGHFVPCNKENMSYVLADGSGGLVGNEFGKS